MSEPPDTDDFGHAEQVENEQVERLREELEAYRRAALEAEASELVALRQLMGYQMRELRTLREQLRVMQSQPVHVENSSDADNDREVRGG